MVSASIVTTIVALSVYDHSRTTAGAPLPWYVTVVPAVLLGVLVAWTLYVLRTDANSEPKDEMA